MGGGAGGLELATQLGRKLGAIRESEITRWTVTTAICGKPPLHEVATGSLDEGVDALSYPGPRPQPRFPVPAGLVVDINREGKPSPSASCAIEKGELLVAERKLPVRHAGHGVGQHRMTLILGVKGELHFPRQPAPGASLHQEMLNLFLKYSANPRRANGKVNIAIVGGGATGVELSAGACTMR
ncbi:hypothetical protein LNP74_24400 [Klebsiella pneumoniae subsp. pneumoniae]|nr:hypothetical protein [Klebsiella pneumoniae subsp. pneumoniae]